MPTFLFEPLGPDHDTDGFECGKPALDRYLRQSARRDRSAGLASIFVLATGREIIGYYTLHQHVIDAHEMPERLKRRLSNYSRYPATLIGRLAVASRFSGKGFGRDILFHALSRALAVSNQAASLAVLVEAIDAEAERFYEHYGFLMLNPEKRRVFLPMKTVKELVG